MSAKLNQELRALLDQLIGANIKPKKAVRLRPQPALVDPGSSKIGGLPWWPAKEPWPSSQGKTCVLLAQLRKDEFPEISFPRGSELLQVLWAPHYPDPSTERLTPDTIVIWRSIGDSQVLQSTPMAHDPSPGLVPVPCQIHPERLEDFPSGPELLVLSAPNVRELVGKAGRDAELFEFCAPGSKVGGYAYWLQNPTQIWCSCGREMEMLLTLASWEYEENTRWEYADPRWAKSLEHTLGRISGLELGDAGYLYLFYCTHCDERPTHAMSQSM